MKPFGGGIPDPRSKKIIAQTPTQKLDWKRIWKIEFWILSFPPWGLWLLWKDPVLSRRVKMRLLLYGVFGALLIFVWFTYLEIHSVQKMLAQAGADSL